MQQFGIWLALILSCGLVNAQETSSSLPKEHVQVTVNIQPALQAAREAAQAGDYAKAEKLYALILDNLPHLKDLRLEYAAVAAKAGQSARSRELLIPLDVDALPPGQRSAYRAIAWGEKPMSFSISPRFGYDSNVNGGSGRDTVNIRGTTFNLSEDSKAQGAMGAGVTMAGQALWLQNSRLAWGGSAVLDSDVYSDSEYNEVRTNLAAGPRLLTGPALLRANALAGRSYLDGDWMENYIGGQLAGTVDIGNCWPVTLSAARRDYSGEDPRYDTIRDRVVSSYAGTIFSRELLPWKGGSYVSFGYDRQDWKQHTEDNSSYRLTVGMELPGNGWADPMLTMSASRRLYDNPIPVLSITRQEWRIDPSVKVALPRLKTRWGVPYVQYSYARNISNVSFTDYDQHLVTGGFLVTVW